MVVPCDQGYCIAWESDCRINQFSRVNYIPLRCRVEEHQSEGNISGVVRLIREAVHLVSGPAECQFNFADSPWYAVRGTWFEFPETKSNSSYDTKNNSYIVTLL